VIASNPSDPTDSISWKGIFSSTCIQEKALYKPFAEHGKAREAENLTRGGCVHLIWDARMPPS